MSTPIRRRPVPVSQNEILYAQSSVNNDVIPQPGHDSPPGASKILSSPRDCRFGDGGDRMEVLNELLEQEDSIENVQLTERDRVQASDQNILCSQVNASFTILVEPLNGEQTITYQDVAILNSIDECLIRTAEVNTTKGAADMEIGVMDFGSYFLLFQRLSSIINGNLTLSTTGFDGIDNSFWFEYHSENTNIIKTTLAACSEIVNNYWQTNPEKILAPAGWTLVDSNYPILVPPPRCRNGTIARAVEDLANNITVSMLSSPNLTTLRGSPTTVNITTQTAIYAYYAFPLLLSYGLRLLTTLIFIIIGFFSILSNGVTHDTSFSSFITTTRNPDLDVIFSGERCLGAVPLDREIEAVKLRLGVLGGGEERRVGLDENEGAEDGDKEKARHVAFGFLESVVGIRK
ncbi:hypothetical protein G7Y89_g7116 [Cudoniella acicularis]|uniref:Uncharacterized protein n=1 Tax=Cudoniella acicularis TaxID=354080 RepID=A0A8H4RL18_9HELO|nr:hypothetical protein G7Y89_g7116 [Cudoniella acicularis]